MHHVNDVTGNSKFTRVWTARVWTGCVLIAGTVAGYETLAAVAPPPLIPDDGDTFDLFVADQEQYDSNLYRLSSDFGSVATLVSPNASRSDLISTASVGGDGQLLAGRQVFDLNLRVDENRFIHNDDLNNTSGYGNFIWNWQLGGHLSGEVQADYNHALASFGETRDFGRDLTNSEHYFGKARYQIGPHWAVYGGASDLDVSHSLSVAKFNDFHLKEGDAGVEFSTEVDNSFGFQYRYADGSFPTTNLFTLNGISFTPNFHEDSERFILKYAVTDKTQVDANVGYYRREFTETGLGAFKGAFWRVTVNWQPTDKTQLVVAGWHELHAYLVNESDYFVSKGASISPVWNATEKFKVDLLLSYEDQDYVPQSFSVVTTGPLNAKVSTEQVDIVYSPRSSWILSGSFKHQLRSANQAYYQFDDQLATVGVLYKIH